MFDTGMLPSDLDVLDADQLDDAGLPLDLESIPPGLLLAVILSSVDRVRLSGYDRVSLLKARARQIAHDQAELLADIQAVSDAVSELVNDPEPDHQVIFDTTATEVSAALSLTRRASEVQVDLASSLCVRLPQVWEALSQQTPPTGRCVASTGWPTPQNETVIAGASTRSEPTST
jgi:hypothetical protein